MKAVMKRETTGAWRPRGSRLRLIGAGLLAVLTLVLGTLIFAIYHADSILQARIIETLSSRFQAPVELTGFHVSVAHGFQVSGRDLKIFGKNDTNIHQSGIQPLISVGEFRFTAGILNLLRTPMRVHRVYLRELELNIPPKGQDRTSISMQKRKIKIYVDEFLCEQARLVINTLKPDKLPLEFDISKLDMREIGPGQPLYFTATLVNPKPVGDIQSDGFFGPGRRTIHEPHLCAANILSAMQTSAPSGESEGFSRQPASTKARWETLRWTERLKPPTFELRSADIQYHYEPNFMPSSTD